jgi:hypothetical protein
MRRVVDANLQSYLEQGTAKYARLFGKSPTFVTYYAADPDASMADVNLGGAIQLVGPESPIRYRVIKDFPLYGVSEADVQSAYDELKGIVNDGVRGEAYCLPGTIEPAENDFFVIDFLKTKLVFRALNTNPDRIEGKSFFKVEYALEPYDPDVLAAQTGKSYIFELGTVGTDQNPLVEMDLAVLLREMEVLEERHRESYWRAFYDRGSGTLLLRSGPVGAPIHDRAVDMFVQRNGLLGGAGYMKSRTVQPHAYADRGTYDDVIYSQLVYRAAERGVWPGSAELIGGVKLARATPQTPASPFFAEFAIDGYYEAMPSSDLIDLWLGCHSDFLPSIDEKIWDADTAMQSLAKRCLHPEGFPSDPSEAIREFNTLMNDDRLLRDRTEQFWLMPIVLMRAKRFRDAARAAE